jgi:hypothetical protein
MTNWHAVLALGAQNASELLTFQGRPIVYDPESADDRVIMGPLLDRGSVWVGEGILGFRATEWERLRRAGASTPSYELAYHLAQAELKQTMEQRYDQRALAWYAAARPLPGDPDGRLSLFQFEGRPVLFADTHAREQEMIGDMQGGWTPIRWGYFPLALTAAEWDALVRDGGTSWARRREDA